MQSRMLRETIRKDLRIGNQNRYMIQKNVHISQRSSRRFCILGPEYFPPNDLDGSESNNPFPYLEVQKETGKVCSNVFLTVAVAFQLKIQYQRVPQP